MMRRPLPVSPAALIAAFFLVTRAVAAPPLTVSQEQAQIQANQGTVAQSDFEKQMDDFEFSSRLAANPQVPIGQRIMADYGGYYAFNYLSADDPSQNTHILRDSELGGFAILNLDNVQTVFFRGHLSYRDYGDGDAFPGGIEGRGEHAAVDQAYYQFDLQKYLAAYDHQSIRDDAMVRLGRQTVGWANNLAFYQNIDGGLLDLTHGPLSFEGVAGITVPDTVDFDTSRPNFDDSTTRGFFGAMLSYQVGQNRPFVYFLSERDLNRSGPLITANGGGAILTNFDYNGVYVGAGSTGNLNDHLLYAAELVGEGGNDLSNSFVLHGTTAAPVIQSRDAIQAFAADGRLDYAFADSHNTRASAEIILATGDRDRVSSTNDTFGGNEPHTNDRAFNGFGLLNTGVAFAPQVSNVIISRVGLSAQPFPNADPFRKLQVGTDVFLFDKMLDHAPIDEPTQSGVYLGWEPDIFVNWQITSDVAFVMRYGAFFPGQTIGKIEGLRSRQLFFTGVTLAF
jgi:alginate export protein